ncbi:MAG: hypothetical protein ABSD46_12475 [Bacteroidota bacterium]
MDREGNPWYEGITTVGQGNIGSPAAKPSDTAGEVLLLFKN